MKKALKRIAYGAGSAALLAPALALAQFQKPSGTNLPDNTVTAIITNGMNWLLRLVGIIGVIGFAIAGILYLTAAGDEDRIKQAKKAMLMSIVGVIVALIGLVALTWAQGLLGGTSTTI